MASPTPDVTPQKSIDPQKASDDFLLKTATAVAHFASALIGKLGAPGAIFFVLAYFFNTNATEAQKQRFIDLWYLLGITEKPIWVLTTYGFLLIFIAGQRYYYQKRLGTKDAEIDRLSGAKTVTQSKKLGKDLNHSKNKPRRGR